MNRQIGTGVAVGIRCSRTPGGISRLQALRTRRAPELLTGSIRSAGFGVPGASAFSGRAVSGRRGGHAGASALAAVGSAIDSACIYVFVLDRLPPGVAWARALTAVAIGALRRVERRAPSRRSRRRPRRFRPAGPPALGRRHPRRLHARARGGGVEAGGSTRAPASACARPDRRAVAERCLLGRRRRLRAPARPSQRASSRGVAAAGASCRACDRWASRWSPAQRCTSPSCRARLPAWVQRRAGTARRREPQRIVGSTSWLGRRRSGVTKPRSPLPEAPAGTRSNDLWLPRGTHGGGTKPTAGASA